MTQYPLPLSLPPVFSEDNFFISASNREAYDWVMRWPDWPGHALLIHGPTGSGKSHLAHIWAARAGAADDGHDHPALIEDIERLTDERDLLHRFNYSRENSQSILLTANAPAAQLPFALPDLRSRLLAIPSAALSQPDDHLLAAALRKQFADRQLKVDEEVIAYILPRIERSLERTAALAQQLDAQALAEHRNLTVPFARRVMESLE